MQKCLKSHFLITLKVIMHIDVYHNTRYTLHVRKMCTPRAIDFLRCATVVDTDDDDDGDDDNNN